MDKLTSRQRSENMRRIRSKDMLPELTVRRWVHGMGYRYRLHNKLLPGKPDLVFSARNKVIFVHGCFWHLHGNCKISRIPKSNKNYWTVKLNKNKERDQKNLSKLRKLGWKSLVIWECQLENHQTAAKKIKKFLGAKQ